MIGRAPPLLEVSGVSVTILENQGEKKKTKGEKNN